MKLRAAVYKEEKPGTLKCVGRGACIAYVPVMASGEPYVSFNFGNYRIHINKKDFEIFCRKYITKITAVTKT